METEVQIDNYLNSQPAPKHVCMKALHQQIRQWLPETRLWFSDGNNEEGKMVSNPSVGYGQFTIRYKDGSTRPFYQIGISAHTTGISVYIMGLADRKALPEKFGATIGKATVTGYCIRFKALRDINLDVLEAAIRYGVAQTGGE